MVLCGIASKGCHSCTLRSCDLHNEFRILGSRTLFRCYCIVHSDLLMVPKTPVCAEKNFGVHNTQDVTVSVVAWLRLFLPWLKVLTLNVAWCVVTFVHL